MDPADVKAGLVLPNAAVALLGSHGAAATLVGAPSSMGLFCIRIILMSVLGTCVHGSHVRYVRRAHRCIDNMHLRYL